MHTLWIACAGVALAELGDKTQLLSLVLAARYRRPWPIVSGILVATLVNHALAALAGDWLGALLTPQVQRWTVGISLLLVAAWTMKPDRIDDASAAARRNGHGVFIATAIAFFLAEMGDKTQVATVALAARYSEWFPVVAGTTLGMLAANVPAVLFGHRFADRLPSRWIHGIAAVLFIVLGGLALRAALHSS